MGKSLKILFLVYHILSPHSGISKKILSQVDGLRENGADVSLCTLQINPDGSKSRVVDGKVICNFGTGLKAKIRKRLSYSDVVEYVKSSGTEAVYIRYDINADPVTVRFIKNLKKAGVRVLVEIPTFPYDGEFKGQGLRMNFQLLLDKCFRKQFFKYCDSVVTYANVDRIFGCKTICISNGVDFSRIPLSKANPYDGTLRMLSVANVHLWHGLDRLIRGMGENPPISSELHIVGDGLESIFNEYREMTARYGLENRVKILGPMYGEALDREFDWCNVAVGSLGRHRSGINDIKTLKNREYAARGRAFFYSENDSDFDNAPYILKFPADESSIDIDEILTFCSKQQMSPEQIRASISHLSWKEQMNKIL